MGLAYAGRRSGPVDCNSCVWWTGGRDADGLSGLSHHVRWWLVEGTPEVSCPPSVFNSDVRGEDRDLFKQVA